MFWQRILPSLALGVSVLAEPLLTVLEDNGFTAFADLLRDNQLLDAGPDLIVYAPSNCALGTDRRRKPTPEEIDQCRKDQYFVNQDALRTRLVRDVAPGGFAYVTLLEHSEFVNLGPGHGQVVVERPTPDSQPLVFSGAGESVNVTGEDIVFDKGVIRPIDGLVRRILYRSKT